MTGMKQGAGEDPFADDDGPADMDSAEEAGVSDTQTSAKSREKTANHRQSSQQMRIPYKFRRDGVQDGRDRVPLFLQGDSKRAERDALREIEQRFDSNVSLTDLREALVRVGLEHLDEVEIELEEWGYGMTFDE